MPEDSLSKVAVMMHSPVFIMILALTPVLIFLPAQIFLTLKTKKVFLQLLPGGISLLICAAVFPFLPQDQIYLILLVLYEILLLILCGIGRVIANSIQKSKRP